jgi:hypothetical protein
LFSLSYFTNLLFYAAKVLQNPETAKPFAAFKSKKATSLYEMPLFGKR